MSKLEEERGYGDALDSIKFYGLATTRHHYSINSKLQVYPTIYWEAYSLAIQDEEKNQSYDTVTQA